MRRTLIGLTLLAACSPARPPAGTSTQKPVAAEESYAAEDAGQAPVGTVVREDTAKATAAGTQVMVSNEWSFAEQGPLFLITAPEGDSTLAFFDAEPGTVDSAKAAVLQAWAAYKPDARWQTDGSSSRDDQDGWVDRRQFNYETLVFERRTVTATAMRHTDRWTVLIYDVSHSTGMRRKDQISTMIGSIKPPAP